MTGPAVVAASTADAATATRTPATRTLLELRDGGLAHLVLDGHARVADRGEPLLRDQQPLLDGEDPLQKADHPVSLNDRPSLGRAAPEMVTVQADHRVRDGREDTARVV